MRTFRYSIPLAIIAFLLCFAGSSIYLIAPLRPFHLGLALIVIVFALDGQWRRTLLQTRSRLVIALGAAMIAASFLWMINPGRYVNYALFFAIGVFYMALGETMVRRGVAFERWFYPLVLFWVVTAVLPVFDTWTNATLFRSSLPITGGVWYNINDMATALVFACLIWLLSRRELPWTLFGAAWIYALGLNRRADALALGILGLGYLLLGLKTAAPRARFALAWAVASVAGMALHGGSFYIGAMPSLVHEKPIEQCTTVSEDAVPLGMIAAQCVHPPRGAESTNLQAQQPVMPPTAEATALPSPAAGPTPAAPAATPAPVTAPPPTTATAPATVAAAPVPAPAVTDVVAHGGDVSSAIRSKILYEMYENAKAMPWWQWLTGMGVGQLNVTWPLDNRPWASPHFFWLEMFFFFGLPWIAFVGWLLWRADGYGRLALIVAFTAGIAPSSLVYFQPFWFLLGVVLATVPGRSDGWNSRT